MTGFLHPLTNHERGYLIGQRGQTDMAEWSKLPQGDAILRYREGIQSPKRQAVPVSLAQTAIQRLYKHLIYMEREKIIAAAGKWYRT